MSTTSTGSSKPYISTIVVTLSNVVILSIFPLISGINSKLTTHIHLFHEQLNRVRHNKSIPPQIQKVEQKCITRSWTIQKYKDFMQNVRNKLPEPNIHIHTLIQHSPN